MCKVSGLLLGRSAVTLIELTVNGWVLRRLGTLYSANLSSMTCSTSPAALNVPHCAACMCAMMSYRPH